MDPAQRVATVDVAAEFVLLNERIIDHVGEEFGYRDIGEPSKSLTTSNLKFSRMPAHH